MQASAIHLSVTSMAEVLNSPDAASVTEDECLRKEISSQHAIVSGAPRIHSLMSKSHSGSMHMKASIGKHASMG